MSSHLVPFCYKNVSRNAGRGLAFLVIATALGVFSGCGGGSGAYGGGGLAGGGGNGGGSGGGGGTSGPPSITLLSPSKLMVGVPLGLVTVFGANFTSDAQVYIDGTASTFNSVSPNQIQTQVSISFDEVAATHIFTVKQASGTSNSATFVVYNPAQGPQPFNAIPGYFPNGADSSNLAMCDVNGDGYADAVMPGPPINNTQTLAVMLGGASGQLAPPTFTSGLNAGVMVCGDVDNDGNPDIVTAGGVSTASPAVSVFLNDGTGNFRQGPTVPYTGSFATALTLADMDGDGKVDLVFMVQGSLYFFKNQGGGAFAAPVVLATPAGDNTSMVVADFNEDGRPDIAYAAKNSSTGQDEMHLLINQGGGAFLDEVAPGITGQAGYFTAGDFNRDGHADLVIEQEASFISVPAVVAQVFFGVGNATFTAGPATTMETNAFQTFKLVVGDFDHDGNPDIAGENGDTEPGHVILLWGDGTGNFTRQQINGPQGFSLTTADVNGDGIPDILVPDRFGIISVILGQNNRTFPSPNSFTPNIPGPLSAGDVNGDHALDLLSPGSGIPPNQPGAGTGNVYLNNGTGQFGFAGNGSPPSQGFLLADLNGDGLADLIGSDGTNLLIWPGTGDPNFSGSNLIVIGPSAGVSFVASELQIADMDGDGRPDLIMPNVVLYNNGNFSFTAVPVTFGYTNSPFVIADFNHDGLLDIAMGAFTLLGQPNRTFRQVTPNGLNMTSGNFAAVGDLNGDGFPDIVFGGNSFPLVIEYGNGDGTFYEQSALPVGPADFSQALAVVDVNGDGRPDIVACLFLSEQCVIYTNDGQGGFLRSYFASGANSVDLLVADLKGNGTPGLAITNYEVDFRPPDFLVVLEK